MTIEQIAEQLGSTETGYTFQAISPSAISVTHGKRQVGVLSIRDPQASSTSVELNREGPYDLIPLPTVLEITKKVRQILAGPAAPPATT
jgi:hypothetical protein